jgi:hypothetical protein
VKISPQAPTNRQMLLCMVQTNTGPFSCSIAPPPEAPLRRRPEIARGKLPSVTRGAQVARFRERPPRCGANLFQEGK